MDDRYPFPTPPIKVVSYTLPKGIPLWRVHSQRFAETAFNPGFGNARFSPIVDANGDQIPTLYAGVSIAAALMETVFHDVPFGPGLKSMPVNRFNDQAISSITPLRPLTLAKLFGPATRHYPADHGGMTQCNAKHYPQTQAWASAIHAAGSVDGLIWMSRQHSDQMALMLFGDRVLAPELDILVQATPITTYGEAAQAIDRLAEEMGLILVDLPT